MENVQYRTKVLYGVGIYERKVGARLTLTGSWAKLGVA